MNRRVKCLQCVESASPAQQNYITIIRFCLIHTVDKNVPDLCDGNVSFSQHQLIQLLVSAK